jgi:3D (Asp-Asp-Asp) domain-containing protein
LQDKSKAACKPEEEIIMRKNPTAMAILAFTLATFFVQSAAAQTVTLNVGFVYASKPFTGFSAGGTITIARFLGTPYNRKVNSTSDLTVGNFTHGIPPTVIGHASIVFQYFPNDNHINIFPGTSHITTSWGTQTCRVYENRTCDCGTNANWQICTGVLPGYSDSLAALAAINRAQAISGLTAAGVRVTQDNVAAADLESVVPGISKAKKISSNPTAGAAGFVGLPGSK